MVHQRGSLPNYRKAKNYEAQVPAQVYLRVCQIVLEVVTAVLLLGPIMIHEDLDLSKPCSSIFRAVRSVLLFGGHWQLGPPHGRNYAVVAPLYIYPLLKTSGPSPGRKVSKA